MCVCTVAAILNAPIQSPMRLRPPMVMVLGVMLGSGFTPEMVVAVWVGFDEPQSLGLPSSRVAVPIWARFVREATGGQVRGAFPPPPDVIRVEIEPTTGALAKAGCPVRRPEYFVAGTEPTRVCPRDWAERERPRRRGRSRETLGDVFIRWLEGVL